MATEDTTPEVDALVQGDPINPAKKALYKKMVDDGLYSKSIDEFSKQFSTPEKVDKLHTFLTSKGKYDKASSEFSKQFFPDVAPQPLKKKDLSAPDSQSGSQTSGLPFDNSQQIEQLTNPTQQVIAAPPVASATDAQAISAQLTNEYHADLAKKQEQTSANVQNLIDQFAKDKRTSAQKVMDTLAESQASVVQKAEAKRVEEEKNNPDYKGSLGNQIYDEAKVARDAVNTGLFSGVEGVVTAANFLAHILPNDVTQDPTTGKDRFDEIKNNVNTYLEKLLDQTNSNVNEKTVKSLNKNPINAGVTGLAGFLPQVLSAESTAGASLFFGGVGDSDREIQKLKKSGVKISPEVEHLMPMAMGAANYMFLHNNPLVKAMPASLRNSVVGKLSAEGVKNLADLGEKATSADVLAAFAAPVMTAKEKISQLGIDGVKSYLKTSADLGGLATADFAIKAAANKNNEDNVGGGQTFEQSKETLMGQYRDIIGSVAPAFAAAGVAQSLLANPGLLFNKSPYSNMVIDRLQKDSSPENVAALQRDIEAIGTQKGWSNDDIANTQGAIPVLADITSKLPKTMTTEEFQTGVELITGRRQLEAVRDETVSRKKDLDPALQGQVGPFEDLLNAKIDQANDKLSSLVTKKPFTYFEVEGEYFKKQEGGEPMPITKARYDLEGIENDHKPESAQSIVIPEGLADKKGNPVPPKDEEVKPKETSAAPAEPKPAKVEAIPVKEEVPAQAKPEQPAKPVPVDAVPVEKAKSEVSKPEEAVKAVEVKTGTKFENNGNRWTHLTNSKEAVEQILNQGQFLGKGEDLVNFTKEVSADRFPGINKENGGSPYFQKGKFYGEPNQKYLITTEGDEKFTPNINRVNAKSFDETGGVGVLNPEYRDKKHLTVYERGDDGNYYKIDEVKPEPAKEEAPVFSHQEEAERHWVQNETDPEAIASRYHQASFDIENTADYKEHKIHQAFGNSKINASDFSRFGDDNLLKGDPDFKRRWIDTTNSQTPLDTEVHALSNDHIEITPQDVVDFITKYKGSGDFSEKSKTPLQKEMESRYAELTGKGLTDKRAEEAFNKQSDVHAQKRIDENVQEIINNEGITRDNIDKLRGEFQGFPYTEEDFHHVKRYLDEQQERSGSEEPKGGAEVAPGGAASEGMGEEKPIKRATAKPDATEKQVTIKQRPTVFDTPSDDTQTDITKQAVAAADNLVETKNNTPAGGEATKRVKDRLVDSDKKAFDELRKKLRANIKQELRQDMDDNGEHNSVSFNHELYSNGIALTNLYFKAGVTSFADYAQEMIADMGEDVVPYLKSFYEGAKNLPGQVDKFDSTDTVDYYINKLTDTSDPERVFVDRVKGELKSGNKLNILTIEGIASESGLSAGTRANLQDYTEQALMEVALDIVDNPLLDDKEKFDELVDLYNWQPSLNQRSSTRVSLGQFSTPLPYSFSAGLYVKAIAPTRIYDPTAGTGMLLVAFDPSDTITNEIDPIRVKILQNLGYAPTTQDALNEPAVRRVEGMMINPPFGPAKESQTFKGYSFTKLEHIITAEALTNLKNGGRAAIVIGGHSEYESNGALKGSDFKFFNYLHHYYNVTDVVNVDGNLFQKQGTTFPTRLILINGRKEVPQGFAPVFDETANKPVKTFEDLHNRIQERISNDENPTVLQSRVDVQPNISDLVDGDGAREIPAKETGRPGAISRGSDNEVGRGSSKGEGTSIGSPAGELEFGFGNDVPAGDSQGDNGERQLVDVPEPLRKYTEGAEAGTIGPETTGEFIPNDRPLSVDRPTADQLVKSDKVTYTPASRLTEAGSVIPSNMAYETEHNLRMIEELYGPVDTFVANELGYPDLDSLNHAFFAEQVDAIALAIHQLKNGKGMIIGDMTGIGKGRIAAGLIRWVTQQGEVPTFFTENADLFSDIYRDLDGIGSGHLMPFIVNDPSSDRDANVKKGGKVIYKAGTIKDKRFYFESKKVPHGTKVILSTYSQINSDRNTLKRGFIQALTKGKYMFLDESHNVAGDSNSGKFFQDLLEQSKGSIFLSATYAKRADNMPVYAIKTSMSDANMSSGALVEAILLGGNALQEIVASQLVKAGQMIRRERDFTGVVNTFVTLGVDDDGKINDIGKKHRELADQVIDVSNAIIDFERTYVVPALEELETKLLKEHGKKVTQTKSKSLSIGNTPFASKMFNIVNQMLFSIKAPDLAHRAIEHLKQGRKPVISFNSTMESFIKNGGYKPGDEISDVSFSASLMNGLKNTLRYRIEYPNGDKIVQYMPLDDLEPDAITAWDGVVSLIKSASAEMSISPIDTITDILEKAGYSVGEITGRSMKLKFNDDHSAATVEAVGKRDTAGIIHDFNNGLGGGKADVILLNASGATGFSMHADKSFSDQRERVMVNGQFELDINKEIQKRGRIDRTNQVRRGAYDYLNSSIPAETRLAMMVGDKLKKLSANTAGDQKSKANENNVVDFLNEYGDHVMTDYLRDNLDIYERLFQGADPAGIKTVPREKPVKSTEGIARKATGRAALLKVIEQEKFYDDVSRSYLDYIDYLNSTDQNTLAVKSVNLEAKVLSKGTFIEGKHTASPFGQDSILEQVEANVLRKPLSHEEVESEIEKSLNGQTPAAASASLIKGLHDHYDNIEEKSIERYQLAFDKQDEKDKKKFVGNQELYRAAKQANLNILSANKELLLNSLAQQVGKMENLFKEFRVGTEQSVPSSMSGDAVKYTRGLFLGFHLKESGSYNPYAPSNVIMRFAVLDGKRMISVSASRTDFVGALFAGKIASSGSTVLRNNWESIVKETKARETRYIVTGNILQAFKPNMGQLVSYTTAEGKINKGILLPKDFNPQAEGKMVNAVAMFNHIMALKPGGVVVSSNGDVSISKSNSQFGDDFTIAVAKATSQGGKYFKNDAILDIVEHGEFETYGGKMIAPVPGYRLMELLKVLESEFNMRFKAGVEMEDVVGTEQNSDRVLITPKSVELKPGERHFVKGKSTERIQAETNRPVDADGKSLPVTKLPDMISELAKGLNVKVYYAKSKRSSAAGSYSPATGGIKLSSVNNLDTAVHEAGHFLDDNFKIFNSMPSAGTMMDELQWFADRGGSNPPSGVSIELKREYLKREGIAEFVRAYAINKAQAQLRAPSFYQHFEDTVPEDVREVINKFGTEYLNYINSTAAESIMANIEELPREQQSAYRKFLNSFSGGKDGRFKLTPFDQLKLRFTNSGQAFNKSFDYMVKLGGGSPDNLLPDENAKMMSLLFAGVDSKIGSFFEDGLVTGSMQPLVDGRSGQRMNMEWLYGAFDSTSIETLNADMALSIAYMFAERTIEKSIQFDRPHDISGISAAGDKSDLDVAVKFLVKEFGKEMPREQKIRVLEGARRYQLWADKMMRYMVDKGRMSESTYRDIKEKNLAYVAFLPVQENAPGIENSFDNVAALTRAANMGSVKTVIREMSGSTMFKRHPYVSLMQNTAAMVKEADRNEVLQSYIDPMIKTTRAMGEGRVNPFANIMMEVTAAEKSAGKPVLSVYIDGEPKFYMFSDDAKDVYEYINGLTKLPQLPALVTALPRMIRFTVTRFPVFAMRNVIRDTFSRVIISRTGSGFGSFLKDRDGEKALFKTYGGDQAGYYLSNRIDYYKLQNQTIKELASSGKGIVLNPATLAKVGWEKYEDLLARGEATNRLAEFKSAYKQAIKPKSEGGLGFDEHNANMYAAFQARDLMDFGVAGTWMKYINIMIPFANAQVQGIKRSIKAASEGGIKGFGLLALRLGLYTLLPTLLMRLLAKTGQYEEEYDNLPPNQRDMFWNFKIPAAGAMWVSIPKPFDMGMASSGIDRAMGAYVGHENAFNGYATSLYQTFALLKPEMSAGPGSAIVEPLANYSFFKEGPIVPRYEEDKLLSLRKKYNSSSRIGKAVSVGVSPFFKEGDTVDPRYVDNLMRSIFSYYGETAMNISDIGSVASRQKFGLKTLGFIKDQQIYGDTRVSKLYDVATDLGLTGTKPMRQLGSLIAEYYDATNPDDRKQLHGLIMETAKSIYNDWMDADIYKEKIESKGSEINFK